MSTLPNAPLAYSLGVVHFPELPEVGRFASGFHERVRAKFPVKDEVDLPQVTVQMSADGLRLDQKEARLWQFGTPDRTTAFVLTSRLLVLHTVRYGGHVEFFRMFQWGLECLKAVESIQLDWMESVGVRYVNRITPAEGEAVSDYLRPAVLPPPLDMGNDVALEEAIHVSRYSTAMGELRFQVLRNPPTVLPPELETPFVRLNGWLMKRPERDFAVVDIDHGARFATLEPMDVASVHRHMLQLRAVAKAVFDGIGTDHADGVWGRVAS